MNPERAPDIEALFEPTSVIAMVVRGGAPESSLLPEERRLVHDVSDTRVREFAAGRVAARGALAELGAAPTAIVRTSRRAPIWPDDITGSIAHTTDMAVAVVATTTSVRVGIDIERVDRITPRVQQRICTDAELEELETLAPDERRRHAAKIFCAKEAFYKAQHQLTESFVGFHEMTSSAVGDDLTLHATHRTPALARLELPVTARFVTVEHLMIGAVAVGPSATTCA